MQVQRVVTVDFARGCLAIGVLIYHVLAYQAHVPLFQIGRFGVYAFFIISGFALYANYHDAKFDSSDLKTYFVARFSRIAPLYYVAVALSLYAYGFSDFSFRKLFLNLSFIMAFANPGEAAMVTGGWSIGIEMAFYVIFPVIIILCGRSLSRLAALSVCFIFTQWLFVNNILVGANFEAAWVAYTQPIAFFGYFASGCLLGGFFFQRPAWKGHPGAYTLATIAIVPFIFVPQDNLTMLTGWIGLSLCLATILCIMAIAFLPEPKGLFRSFAEWIGEMSYPVYLLHPIVYYYVAKMSGTALHLPVTIAVTFALSELVHRFIERPLIGFLRMRFDGSVRKRNAPA